MASLSNSLQTHCPLRLPRFRRNPPPPLPERPPAIAGPLQDVLSIPRPWARLEPCTLAELASRLRPGLRHAAACKSRSFARSSAPRGQTRWLSARWRVLHRAPAPGSRGPPVASPGNHSSIGGLRLFSVVLRTARPPPWPSSKSSLPSSAPETGLISHSCDAASSPKPGAPAFLGRSQLR